ncbi:hypothetical protein [Azospirillum sp. TSO35-2]|uniref:hypothetical protein n=1 Tax=Azospirillum sp. TSO35-2 TaxID=716796 RepID=UPI000D61F311|nr:hypothetical protein [Azospirillum sp. TSO35-2]PWC35974.1 hypothetical protein TSO352_12335 [Azospirillum sp. TSO35-2]
MVLAKRGKAAGLALVALLGVAACNRQQPIYTVTDHPVPPAAQPLPMKSVEQAIVEAAAARRWTIERLQPGLMRATQKWRTHTMVVNIRYTQDHYSIEHVMTSNLKEQGGTVHRAYNTNVKALENEIEQSLHRANR